MATSGLGCVWPHIPAFKGARMGQVRATNVLRMDECSHFCSLKHETLTELQLGCMLHTCISLKTESGWQGVNTLTGFTAISGC